MSTRSRATSDSQLGLVDDRDAVRVERPGQLGRVAAAVDVGDLGRGEGDHLDASGRRGTATLKSWKSRPAAPRMTTRSRGWPRSVRSWRSPSRLGRPPGCGTRHSPMLRPVWREGDSEGDGRRTSRDGIRASTRAANRSREGLPRRPKCLAGRLHLPEQRLLLGGQAVGGVPPQPGAEHLRARSRGGTARPTPAGRSASPAGARRAASRAPCAPGRRSSTTSSL